MLNDVFFFLFSPNEISSNEIERETGYLRTRSLSNTYCGSSSNLFDLANYLIGIVYSLYLLFVFIII